MCMHDFLEGKVCCRWLSISCWLLLLSAAPSIVGCGSGQASVSGTVTLDGQPVIGSRQLNGTVSFYRESGGAPAIGIIDESGRYTLKTGGTGGLEPGNYRVGISIRQIIPPANPADMPAGHIISPAKYGDMSQSGLKADVKPGSNTFDFALQSK
jgi:hypothetical protein